MRVLHVTTPLMQGGDVRQLQVALHKAGYLKSAIDGQYGPLTAQAVYRAKFWLGYPRPDHNAGPLLYGYLTGAAAVPKPMVALAAIRHQRKPATPLRVKALQALTQKLGTKESPAGSNRCFASAWYGLVGPWCAMAVSWAYSKAGSKAFAKGRYYAYVPAMVADAHAGRNGLAVTSTPQPGDIACYDWDGDRVADHVGLFERWVTGDDFDAIEGNTAVGNESDGGEVMRRQRSRSNVLVFIHAGR